MIDLGLQYNLILRSIQRRRTRVRFPNRMSKRGSPLPVDSQALDVFKTNQPLPGHRAPSQGELLHGAVIAQSIQALANDCNSTGAMGVGSLCSIATSALNLDISENAARRSSRSPSNDSARVFICVFHEQQLHWRTERSARQILYLWQR